MLSFIGLLFIGFVALQHVGFLALEMFFWARPVGLRIFRQTPAQAQASRALAANQGLYNGFLAAGLAWSLAHPDVLVAFQLQVFFLSCVVVAGVFGAVTVSRRILLVQALPAGMALGLRLAAVFGGPIS